MKLPALATAIALAVSACTPALAADDLCTTASLLAERVMTERQSGARVADVMDRGKENELYRTMVKQAFSEPLYRSVEYRQRAVSEFANGWYLDCARYMETR